MADPITLFVTSLGAGAGKAGIHTVVRCGVLHARTGDRVATAVGGVKAT